MSFVVVPFVRSSVRPSRVAQEAYLEVEYIRNVLSVSGTLKYADSGTAWCHSGNIEQFFRTILKSPLSAKTLLHCLCVLRAAATNYRIQTERPRLRAFAIYVKPWTLLHFFVKYK